MAPRVLVDQQELWDAKLQTFLKNLYIYIFCSSGIWFQSPELTQYIPVFSGSVLVYQTHGSVGISGSRL